MLSEAKQTGGKISMALGLMYMRTMHLHIALHVKGSLFGIADYVWKSFRM